jgi:hypothetical protein
MKMTEIGRKRKACFREAYAKSSHSVHDPILAATTLLAVARKQMMWMAPAPGI